MFRINGAKKRTWKRIAPAHAVEQAGCADMRAHTGTKICDHQSYSHNGEQWSPRSRHGPDVRGIGIREWLGCGPDKLRDVDLSRRKNADHHARQHGGQHYIAPGILSLFGEGGDAVETYVRQYSNGSTTKQVADRESLRIVERPGKKVRICVWMAEDVPNRAHEDNYDHRAHPRGQAGVYARG